MCFILLNSLRSLPCRFFSPPTKRKQLPKKEVELFFIALIPFHFPSSVLTAMAPIRRRPVSDTSEKFGMMVRPSRKATLPNTFSFDDPKRRDPIVTHTASTLYCNPLPPEFDLVSFGIGDESIKAGNRDERHVLEPLEQPEYSVIHSPRMSDGTELEQTSSIQLSNFVRPSDGPMEMTGHHPTSMSLA